MKQLSIQIGNDFLDLAAGTQLQLVEENPILQLTDTVLGPYSMPFVVPHTEKNLRILGMVSAVYTDKTKISLPAIIWENGVQHSVGTIKVEQVLGNLNDARQGASSLYYLTGTSSFFDLVQDIKLNAFEFGGLRTFQGLSGTNYNQTFGFGQHLAQVAQTAAGVFDYAFFPVKNEAWQSEDGTVKAHWMNTVDANGLIRILNSATTAHTPICPFPYVKYVLQTIFKSLGYTLLGEILNDRNFIKICLLSFRDILYCSSSLHSDGTTGIRMKASVSFDLKNYMPDVTVGSFLISLKNRFGWYYDFDIKSKTCTILYLKDVINGASQDITSLIHANYQNRIDLKGKVYALTTTVDAGDSYTGAPDFAGKTFLGNFSSVPLIVPSEAIQGSYYFLEHENAFYICRATAANENVFDFEKYTDNIYDYLPAGNNETINSIAEPVSMERTDLILTSTGTAARSGIFPRADVQGIWQGKFDQDTAWGIRLAFFHGFLPDDNLHNYPYASNHPLNNQGVLIGDWALSYEFNDVSNGVANGLYNIFWKDFLARIKQHETYTVQVRYPFSEKNNIKFGDGKIIQHTRFFVKTKTSFIPYDGQLQIDLIKI